MCSSDLVWDEISSFHSPSTLIKEGVDPPDQRAELGHYGDLRSVAIHKGYVLKMVKAFV